jgi:4-hydroxybenzoate polyprenyltransferase
MLRALFKSMRPQQWAKNALIFVALVFDRQLTNLPSLWITIQGFVSFSLLASAIYILNDLIDVEADRLHPRKRLRPIAAGQLPLWLAYAAVVLFVLQAFVWGSQLSVGFAIVCGVYLVLNLAYSLWLKHIPIIDVIGLASFYVLRVAAGVLLIEVNIFSPWLYLFTTFLALFLGIGKRRAEMLAQKEGGGSRPVLALYTSAYLDQLLLIVLTLMILTYGLYTFSAENLPGNHAMMLTIPFVIYGGFRYLYLVQVSQTGEAPEEILFSDRPIQATLVLWAATILLIFYLM